MSEPDTAGRGPIVAPPPETRPPKVRTRPATSMFEPSIMRRGFRAAFLKLDPRHMARNPVMFVVEIGSVVTTVQFLAHPDLFVGLITFWLWATVLFANFAEAVAEGGARPRRTPCAAAARKPSPTGCGTTARWTRSPQRGCSSVTCAW